MKVPKRERKRLAKSELLMLLACEAESWAAQCGSRTNGKWLPFDEWGKHGGEPDSLTVIARRYELSGPDLDKILHRIGDEIENRALRAGFDEHWDD